MKKFLTAALLALAWWGVSSSSASAICFDVYQPCIKLSLPRLPIFLPKICVGCEPCNKTHAGLAYNRTYNYGPGGCCAYPFGTGPDCNRPLYPNPGHGWNACANGQAGPWYNYFPPAHNHGGGYGPPVGAFYGPGGGVPSYWNR